MKIAKLSILLFPLFALMPQLAEAQQFRTMEFDAGTSMMLQEFQAMLILDGNLVKVELKMGRDEAKPGEDRLEQGDVILMMNGKRVKDIEGLRELYEGIEKDSEIKIGVRRGEERFILTAIKGEVPEGGSRMVMNVSTEDQGDGEQPVIIPSVGLLLANSDDGVLIERIIPPMLPDELKPLEVEGYRIISFNGETPESAANLKDKIDAIAIGDDISLTFEKDGEEKSITIKKTAPKGNFSINTRDN